MSMKDIYNFLPIPIQNIVCDLKGIQINHTRFNKDFLKTLDDFNKRTDWNHNQLKEYRDDQIRRLVRHCYETVPFYRNAFNERGIDYRSINGLDDLKLLPVIDKKIVLQNSSQFVSTKVKQYKVIHSHTSGTTGAGFRFLTTQESIQAQWATFWRLYIKTGISRDERQATFSGQMVVPTRQSEPPFWRYVNSQNRVYFSAYHEKEETMRYYYEELKKSEITWINGYPSLIAPLAEYMLRNNLCNPGIRFVSTGAENLYDYQGNQIKQAFEGAHFIQTYGQAENVAFFSQDAKGNIWVEEDAAAVEFIPNDGFNYDIIGTNLYNYAMPLLRYKTGDQARIDIHSDGRRRVIAIDGRSEDYIYLPSGIKLGKLDTAFKDAVHISESQIYQREDYSIIIKAVLKSPEGKSEVEMAKKWIVDATGSEVPVSIEYVDMIPRTKTQKLRYVISEVVGK